MRKTLLVLAAGLTTILATATASITAAQAPQLAALPATLPAPADNPTTPDRVALGRATAPMFWDFTAHVLGVPDSTQLAESDAGVNKTYAFRTPSLRNLGPTAPYMHNGVLTTLPQVINFYQRISRGGGGRGGRGAQAANPHVSREQIDPLARGLRMGGRGQRDLIAFLEALNDPTFDRTIPERVPSGLPVGGTLTR